MSDIALIPGWALGRGPLQPLADALEASFLDLPGYGHAPACRDFSAATDQLAARLSAPTTLIGWSLGALMALALAIRHPERVRRLVLIGATASFVARPHWPHGLPATALSDFADALADNPAGTLRRFVSHFNQGEANARPLNRSLLQRADPLPATATLQTGLGWLQSVDLSPLLPRLACPLTCLHGARDPLMPLQGAQALVSQTPAASLVVFPEAAHAPFLSAPAACLSALKDALFS